MVFWVARGTYPYRPEKKTIKKSHFIDQLSYLYQTKEVTSNFVLPDFKKIRSSELRNKIMYSEREINGFNQTNIQSYHPPLYYLFASSFFRLADSLHLNLIDHIYFVRLFSGLLYFGSVFFAYKILELFFRDKDVSRNVLLFFSLNPEVLKMGIAINHDMQVVFFSLLFLYFFLFFHKKISFTHIILLGIISAGATLSKFSGVFTAVTFAGYQIIQTKLNGKMLKNILFFGTTIFVFMLPWFAFNYQRYKTPMIQNIVLGQEKPLQPHSMISSFALAAGEFRHTFMHYAGFLGWNETYIFKWFFLIYAGIFALLSFMGFYRCFKKKSSIHRILVLYTSSLFLFLFVFGFYEKRVGVSWDIQGRYLLPAFLPLVVFMTTALSSFIKHHMKKASVLMSMFSLFHYYLILFFVLIPKYYV